MPLQDGPRYHPGVCILSLGAPCVLRFYRKMTEGVPTAVRLIFSVTREEEASIRSSKVHAMYAHALCGRRV